MRFLSIVGVLPTAFGGGDDRRQFGEASGVIAEQWTVVDEDSRKTQFSRLKRGSTKNICINLSVSLSFRIFQAPHFVVRQPFLTSWSHFIFIFASFKAKKNPPPLTKTPIFPCSGCCWSKVTKFVCVGVWFQEVSLSWTSPTIYVPFDSLTNMFTLQSD